MAKTSVGLRKWREKQKSGAIMRPSTFKKIERKAAAAGADNPEAVAGAAYWATAKAKYRGRETKGSMQTGGVAHEPGLYGLHAGETRVPPAQVAPLDRAGRLKAVRARFAGVPPASTVPPPAPIVSGIPPVPRVPAAPVDMMAGGTFMPLEEMPQQTQAIRLHNGGVVAEDGWHQLEEGERVVEPNYKRQGGRVRKSGKYFLRAGSMVIPADTPPMTAGQPEKQAM